VGVIEGEYRNIENGVRGPKILKKHYMYYSHIPVLFTCNLALDFSPWMCQQIIYVCWWWL